jgi:hypothetical protein
MLTAEQCQVILNSLNIACKNDTNTLAAAEVCIPIAIEIEQMRQEAIKRSQQFEIDSERELDAND